MGINMNTSKKNMNGGVGGLFLKRQKNKVYLNDAIKLLKNNLLSGSVDKEKLIKFCIDRYSNQSIYPYEQNKNTSALEKNVSEMQKFEKSEFAYKKYKYYIILYSFVKTFTNRDPTTKVLNKKFSFKSTLSKTFN